MSLNFPAREDIYLQNAPLREVICQVRFPTLLRIATEEPVEFQEHIRQRFPELDIEPAVRFPISVGREAGAGPPVFRFHSSDRARTVSVAPSFFAISTTEYSHWADFRADLEYGLQATRAVYGISYATRIGLRYSNALDLSDISLEDLFAIVRPELTQTLRLDTMVDPLIARHEIRAAADDDGVLTFRFGLVREEGQEAAQFALDFDRYIEGNLPLDDLLERCDRYHEDIYRAFRWSIAEGQIERFGPIGRDDAEVI